MAEQQYDLKERLLDYSAAIIRLDEKLPNTRAANHVGGQLLRSGTSPLFNHGEAQAAESTKDFIHKMSISLKELRESHFWLRLIERSGIIISEGLPTLVDESNQLLRIFGKSVTTARKNDPSGKAWRDHTA